jgi:Sec-independent protein translocase protein TatA
MGFIRRMPWWGWAILAIVLLSMFGKTKLSVGNVSVGGMSLGGYNSESSEKKAPAK